MEPLPDPHHCYQYESGTPSIQDSMNVATRISFTEMVWSQKDSPYLCVTSSVIVQKALSKHFHILLNH